MIKVPDEEKLSKVTVYLKTSEVFCDRDIPPQPFSDNEQLFSFWISDDKLAMFPISEIERIDFIMEEDDEDNS